ncbi:MAG: hypothetical protein HZY75_13515 [Nocardioidaceae bacterium]|nr:MAG: hypothetical protein HZY75_13515 [Nocardioidaceae bacterium]
MNDGEIVTSLVTRDPAGLSATFDAYAYPLHDYALTLLGSRAELAPEMVAQTLHLAYDRAPDWPSPASSKSGSTRSCASDAPGSAHPEPAIHITAAHQPRTWQPHSVQSLWVLAELSARCSISGSGTVSPTAR